MVMCYGTCAQRATLYRYPARSTFPPSFHPKMPRSSIRSVASAVRSRWNFSAMRKRDPTAWFGEWSSSLRWSPHMRIFAPSRMRFESMLQPIKDMSMVGLLCSSNRPNKAPEPTSGSVTPRATSRVIESEQMNVSRRAARVAPAPAVAHLWRWAKLERASGCARSPTPVRFFGRFSSSHGAFEFRVDRQRFPSPASAKKWKGCFAFNPPPRIPIRQVAASRARVSSVVFDSQSMPNKALEPTSTSVMPRAILPFSELKPRTKFSNQARVMPAVAVAHLWR